VRVSNLDTRDHVDFLMALGEALFFEDDFGAAATLFESGIDRAIAQGTETGEAMLEWWGSSVERYADGFGHDGRVIAFERLRERMSRELSRNRSAAAAYPRRRHGRIAPIEAWNAAIAGWVRARMAGARSASLRADLDRSCSGNHSDRVQGWPPTGAPRPKQICARMGRRQRTMEIILRPTVFPMPASLSGTLSLTAFDIFHQRRHILA
jgi:hypothetical protein